MKRHFMLQCSNIGYSHGPGSVLETPCRLSEKLMLYQVHEMQRAALEPWRWWAQASADALGSPFSPLSLVPNSKSIVASLDLMLRLTKRYGRPPFGIHQVEVNGKAAKVEEEVLLEDRKSTRLNSSHTVISYAVFCLRS